MAITKRDRNSIIAKADMLNAVKKALIKHGFSGLGINAVADEAKIDKSAIYRYFGNFEGLLDVYIEKQDYWLQSIQQHEVKDKITKELAKKIIREQYLTLFDNKELQELIKWEIADKKNIALPITVKREIYSKSILEQSRKVLDKAGINFNFILSVILGGIYYVVLHKDKGEFCEVDLLQKKHKDEFINTLDWLIDLIFETNKKTEQLKRSVIKSSEKGLSPEDIADIFEIPLSKVNSILK